MHRAVFQFDDRLDGRDPRRRVGPAWWPLTAAGLFDVPPALLDSPAPAVTLSRGSHPAVLARGPGLIAALRAGGFDGPAGRVYRNAGEWAEEPCGALLTIAGVPGGDVGGGADDDDREVAVLPPGLLDPARRVLAELTGGDGRLLPDLPDEAGDLDRDLERSLGGPGCGSSCSPVGPSPPRGGRRRTRSPPGRRSPSAGR